MTEKSRESIGLRMVKRMEQHMDRYEMCRPGDAVIVGFSGGPDSLCLLWLLLQLREERELHLTAVHVHHGIRGAEADRDAAWSEEFCRSRQVPFQLVRTDAPAAALRMGVSLEEAGRLERYRILEEAAEKTERESGRRTRIAVAHHRDDAAETILFNLFRGSGLRGLSGIDPVRGRIIRPLLFAGREEILACLREAGLSWVEDSTNGENEYARNRIRNEILPCAKEHINAGAAENILRAGEQIRQADAYFEAEADRLFAGYGTQKPDGVHLNRAPLAALPGLLQGYVIRRAIRETGCGLRDLTAAHLEAAEKLLTGETGKRLNLPGGLTAEIQYGDLIFRTGEAERERKEISLKLDMQVLSCENPDNFPRNPCTKWFDYDKIKDTLSVRYREPGDFITLASGGKKTVKAYMIDEKIPREKRERIPLLAEGHHILWIVGWRISEYYKVTEKTKKILEVKVNGGTDCGR